MAGGLPQGRPLWTYRFMEHHRRGGGSAWQENGLKQEQDAEKAALLLTSAFEMGLEREMEPVYETVSRIILEDTRFYAVAEALSRLRMLQELQGLYRVFLPFEKLIEGCYEKLVILLPSMTRIREEDLDMTMKALKLLYQTGGRPAAAVRTILMRWDG